MGTAPKDYELEVEYQGQEQIDGWVVPYPIREATGDIFKRFGLWVSSHGLCVNGKNHAPFRAYGQYFENNDPILVGDFINNKQVLYAHNQYQQHLNRYTGHVIYGIPPMPKNAMQNTSPFLQELLDVQGQLNNQILELVEEIFNQILPLCLTPANGSLQTGPAQAIFITAIEKAQSQLQQRLKELEQKLI